VEQGKQAISLIFHDANRDIRLIGNFGPLLGGNNNIPSDPFEQQSLALALQGKGTRPSSATATAGTTARSESRSATPSTRAARKMCHTNFTPQFFHGSSTHNPDQWVGALTLRVPVK
jgi:hypothetical protein